MAKLQKASTIHKKAMYLNYLGKKFTLIKINNTFKLKSEYFGDLNSAAKRKIPPIELGFIKRVKNHIINNKVHDQFIDKFYSPSDIDYVAIKKRNPDISFDDVIEIDIDEAYWKTALLLNVISQDLYIEGSKDNKKISKMGRLICLGSLAKKEERYHFNGKQLRKREVVRSVLTENIWYTICKRISDVMTEAEKIAGEDFIMYWVDGIYLRNDPEKVRDIIKMFNESGYDIKQQTNLAVNYSENQIHIENTITKTSRPFFIPNDGKRKSPFTDQKLRKLALEYSKFGAADKEIYEL